MASPPVTRRRVQLQERKKETVKEFQDSKSSRAAAFFGNATAVYGAAAALRIVLLVYGLWQDANSPVKYTDIDYLVFTDAARFVAKDGGSPYDRETYRYTPLLAWLLLPTAAETGGVLGQQLMFASGKVLFAAADLVAGWLLERVLREQLRVASPAHATTARIYASVWLLNPMVAAISTRGSAEGLLGALVAALLWAVHVARQPLLAGLLLGAGVHLKIYPFIYAPAIVWWMDADNMGQSGGRAPAKVSKKNSKQVDKPVHPILAFVTPARLQLAGASLAIFVGLNLVMYSIYGFPFLQHTYLHHVTRIDHRHNFSPYNTQLYLSSAAAAAITGGAANSIIAAATSTTSWLPPIESLAFAPQLLLATVLLPLVLAKKDLPATLLAQTFAFVAFNKVCTSQYFLWYMVLLPVYLPQSSFVQSPRKGVLALVLWVAGQAAWLQQGFLLEFLGQSTFVPGLWLASLGFFMVNCWILGVIVGDVAGA
ncbi:phosphatidylinositol glycan, class M [Sporothrix brasiliensis 5110]|uniref:GPI mannosyltransferase 1 n=1 Tax=Sporothrix brasiliensis 5110 TaxID=1398154 RepID=A0A0C2FIT9_9PEZI|nr:phosphatidylinositol glycan, class M [Sporothrix brasiliensis 5110]KIH91048.1 phosphatidylinositol glycan, class M [Sporothrix brasiliensis 5110]